MARVYDQPAYRKARHRLRGLPCVDCGNPSDTVDHAIPVSRGGTNELSNLRPMCGGCNSRRGGRLNKGRKLRGRRRRVWRNGVF